MKKVAIFFMLIVIISALFVRLNVFDQLVGLLFVGLIPYTSVSISPFVMLLCWALLPVFSFGGFHLMRGIYIVSMIVSEQIEFTLNARRDAHKKAQKSTKSIKNPTTFHGRLARIALAAAKSTHVKFPKLPKQRFGKVPEL